MNFYIPPNWVPVTEAQLQGVLDNTQYEGDGWYDGIAFRHRHNREHFAFKPDAGGYMVDPNVFDKEPVKS